MNFKEIKISMPWGFIAAKTWGDEKNDIVIAQHGLQDNANSFTKLIPLLPDSFYYICIDMPSHGQSSHLPTNTFPTSIDFVLTLKLLLDRLGRKKYILMGHSFGGRTETLFTQIYPEYVSMLIMLDASYFTPVEPEDCIQFYKSIFAEYEKQLTKIGKQAPTYNKADITQRLVDSRYSIISDESAEILLDRVLVPAENNKYKLSTAQHLKYILRIPSSTDYLVKLFKYHPITCPHLLVMAEDGESKMNKPILKEMEKNKDYELHIVQGQHDVHLDYPERVAPIITKFLLKYKFSNKL